MSFIVHVASDLIGLVAAHVPAIFIDSPPLVESDNPDDRTSLQLHLNEHLGFFCQHGRMRAKELVT